MAYEENARDIKFTESQSAMLDYYRREQWKMEQQQWGVMNQLLETAKCFRRQLYVLFLLILVHIALLVLSVAILFQRVDCVERTILRSPRVAVSDFFNFHSPITLHKSPS